MMHPTRDLLKTVIRPVTHVFITLLLTCAFIFFFHINKKIIQKHLICSKVKKSSSKRFLKGAWQAIIHKMARKPLRIDWEKACLRNAISFWTVRHLRRAENRSLASCPWERSDASISLLEAFWKSHQVQPSQRAMKSRHHIIIKRKTKNATKSWLKFARQRYQKETKSDVARKGQGWHAF